MAERIVLRRVALLGRATTTFIGYTPDEAPSSSSSTSSGTAIYPEVADDYLFEQSETTLDENGNPILSLSRARHHNASGTGDLQGPNGPQPKSRDSYTCLWYDGIGRRIAVADYGTNDGEPVTHPESVPERSDNVLVADTHHNDRGEGYATVDQADREDRTTFDDAGRTVETVENYVVLAGGEQPQSDQNRTVRRTYTADGQLATLTAVNPTTGDQTTRYIYGTTLAESFIARADLLRAEIYPDSDDNSWLDDGPDQVYDRVEYTYYRDGRVKSKKDQNETVHGYIYDQLGRERHDSVAELGAGVDGRVRRISKTYNARGQAEKLTSHTHPTPGCGDVANEVFTEYNVFGLPIAEYQSHSGPADMVNTPNVQYGYDATIEGCELTTGLRPTSLIYPNGRVLHYDYAAGDDGALNRITSYFDDDGATALVRYHRLGLNAFIRVDYPEPTLTYNLDPADDATYGGLDRFGRVVDLLWKNETTAEEAVHIRHGYDRAGNRTYREDVVARAAGVDMDELYQYDELNQLSDMQRGALNTQKTAIAAPNFAESWDLDATGNWAGYSRDEDGDGESELIQTRAHNKANELTTIDGTAGDLWISPEHDHAGNMLRLPKPGDTTTTLALEYDAWNRLARVSNGSMRIAEYEYDGGNRRIFKWLYIAGSNMCEHVYLGGHQVIETRQSPGTSASECVASSTADRQFVWDQRYIDMLILRDRDLDGDAGCTSATDERLYFAADANFNVVGLFSRAADPIERYAYQPYGEAIIHTPTYAERRSASACDKTTLFTGRELDTPTGLVYYRARYYDMGLGKFTQRDPLLVGVHPDMGQWPTGCGGLPSAGCGCTSSASCCDGGLAPTPDHAYRYAENQPLTKVDPTGMSSRFVRNCTLKCEQECHDLYNSSWNPARWWQFMWCVDACGPACRGDAYNALCRLVSAFGDDCMKDFVQCACFIVGDVSSNYFKGKFGKILTFIECFCDGLSAIQSVCNASRDEAHSLAYGYLAMLDCASGIATQYIPGFGSFGDPASMALEITEQGLLESLDRWGSDIPACCKYAAKVRAGTCKLPQEYL